MTDTSTFTSVLMDSVAAALERRSITCHLEANSRDGMKILTDLIDPPTRIVTGDSRTLREIGFISWVQSNLEVTYCNNQVRDIADPVGRLAFRRQGLACD